MNADYDAAISMSTYATAAFNIAQCLHYNLAK